LARNNQLNFGKILGIHVAGSPGRGYSTPLYQEDVKKILNSYHKSEVIASEQCLPVFNVNNSHIPNSNSFLELDQLEKEIAAPLRSVISPSVCFDKLGTHRTKPCQLISKNGFDPMLYRLEKFSSSTIPISNETLNNSYQATYFFISNQILKFLDNKTCEKAVFSFDEAIEGIDGEEYMNSIKRNSSPGYPFVFDPQWKNKINIFGPGPDFNRNGELYQALEDSVENIIENAKQGIRLKHVFIDTLKDERKPIHKAHKTRMFSACPLDYLVACKRYFMGVVSLISKARNFCGISVGTNAFTRLG